ncbi:hypothetical protein ACH41E_01115 [Streptomyces sp. NPDC020412]|uniref:hypothetical protein n=1 Tax=Streptomyces sp. NPDC020412 TaxID=3365073 RepID=UPI003787F81A
MPREGTDSSAHSAPGRAGSPHATHRRAPAVDGDAWATGATAGPASPATTAKGVARAKLRAWWYAVPALMVAAALLRMLFAPAPA